MKRYFKLLSLMLIISCCLVSCSQDEDLVVNPDSPTQTDPNSPERKRSCSSTEHMEKLMQDDAYRKNHEMKYKRLNKYKDSPQFRALCNSPITIPVAVHFQGASNPDQSCLRALAIAQIEVLNQDFQGRNSDISIWRNTASASFPGVNNGETCLEFVLGNQNHPSGSNLSNGDPAITINQTNGDSNSAWSGYLNIYVIPNTGFLGYSPLGGSGDGDGVVVDASAFGLGASCGNVAAQSPYTLGRTLTHEVGHYLLLDHIWGGGCSQDDNIADTPPQGSENYGCPAIGVSTCSTPDLHMNYMDYTDDACMYMFSAGQSSVMEGYVGSSLQAITNNASNVISGSGGPTPTCTDGIQNGDETGVDCGGSCQPCQTDPTCTDGIQNGDETGVDCGGSCQPCQTDPTCNDGIQNGDETGVDCGGSCAACDDDDDDDDTEECEDYTITVQPDDYGSEIDWVLLDEEGYVLAEGGYYYDNDDTADVQDLCLEEGCYTFVISDAFGDGICCAYGEGYYIIEDGNGDLIAGSDGQYGYYEIQEFCVGEAQNGKSTVITDKVEVKSSLKGDSQEIEKGQKIGNEIKTWLKQNKDATKFRKNAN